MVQVCLVSSGTGGHLRPAMVLADALRDRGDQVMLVTEGRAVEREFLNGSGLRAEVVDLGRTGLGQFMRLVSASMKARRVLRQHKIGMVISTGGRTSIPVGLAARSLGIPLVLLEQNTVAGRANRLLLPLARKIYLGLPPRRHMPKAMITGTPLRPEFASLDRKMARHSLGLLEDEPVVLVTGGSQGASVLNSRVPEAICGLDSALQVVHLSGRGKDLDVHMRYGPAQNRGLRAKVLPVAQDMAALYAAADLVICRGGGCTVSELIAVGRAGIIVPYPHHRDRQQWHNGRVLVEVGAAVMIPQTEFSASRLRKELTRMLGQKHLLSEMGQRAATLSCGDACRTIIEDLQNVGRSRENQ